MREAALLDDVNDKHVVIYGCQDGEANGVFYAEYEPRYGITFTTDTPDYTGLRSDDLFEALYDQHVFTVTTTLHHHVGEHHSKDYTAEFTEETNPKDVLSYVLALYDNDDWEWLYHTEPLP
jgi:hypothetical protein